jgi:hypothetical protein
LRWFPFGAEGVNGGADFGSVFGGDLKLFAIEVQAAVFDAIGDAAIGGGANAGELGDMEVALAELVETANEVVGLGTADAEVALGVLVPGEAKRLKGAGIAGLFEAVGLSGGTMAGDDGEGLLVAGPRAGIGEFGSWHGEFRFFPATIVARIARDLLKTKGLFEKSRHNRGELLQGSKKRGLVRGNREWDARATLTCLERSRPIEQGIRGK